MRNFNLDEFVRAYAECALWSSTVCDSEGNDPRPMDDEYGLGDIAPECVAAMRTECADFIEANANDLEAMDAERAGHDFWLTRNGHGAGFWDRGLGELGERLTKAAEVYGSVDLYPGDDGLIHC